LVGPRVVFDAIGSAIIPHSGLIASTRRL